MFDGCGFDLLGGEITDLDAAAALSVAAGLRSTADLAESRLLQLAAHYADLHPRPKAHDPHDPPDTAERAQAARRASLPGMERSKVYGGEGCPPVAEFAPVELGTALGISSGTASSLIGDALALRHRLPLTWARVLAGEVQAWRARQVAAACWPLSEEAAGLVDARVFDCLQELTPYRLGKIVQAAVMEADPELAKAQAEKSKKARGVWVGQSDLFGTKNMVVKAAAGDVIRFDARLDQIATILADLGDTDNKDLRRSKAIGWLANPSALEDLLSHWHTTRHPHESADHTDHTDHTERAQRDMGSDSGQTAADKEAGGRDAADDDGPDAPDVAEVAGQQPVSIDRESDRDTECTASDTRPSDGRFGEGGTGESGPGAADGHGDSDGDAYADSGGGQVGQVVPIDRASGLSGPFSGGRYAPAARSVAGLPSATVYVHLTDEALISGAGLIRVGQTRQTQNAGGVGPLLASQLAELLGDPRLVGKIVLKPVIDLADQISVDAYEIPDRIRERILLRHQWCIFPWCNRPATTSIDLDHIEPYDHSDTGPPGQTSTENLGPGCRLHHRCKTHGDWHVRRLADGAFEWTSPHGWILRVDHTGTHIIAQPLTQPGQSEQPAA